MALPNFYIILGTCLIAIGGLVATHGWNARSDMIKKNGMLKAVAAEYLVYEAVILDTKFTETNKENLFKFVVYPRFQTIALESAISSGLFLEKEDKEFYTRAVNLHEIPHELNKRISISESSMLANNNSIMTTRIKMRDGNTRKSALVKLSKFGDLLEKKYGIDFKEPYFVKLEEDQHKSLNQIGAKNAPPG